MDSKRSLKDTDNVLVNLGFEDAKVLTAKASLAVKLNDLIVKCGLSQTDHRNDSAEGVSGLPLQAPEHLT